MIEEKLKALLDEKFLEEEFTDCFLIDIELKGANQRVEVYLDSDEGISFRKCQRISRYLEAHLDEEGWLGEKYTLEVSSPGVKRPLKFPRQFPKHIGRKLEVKTTDGEKFVGKLKEVTDSKIALAWTERIKEGKKKKNVDMEKEIPFSVIDKAIVKISFN